MKKMFKNFWNDNKGASLITVVVTVTFLAILGTMLIGAALVNYQMKKMDLRNKKDFYTVETVLDDVYNGLGRDMTNIIATSYEQALQQTDKEAFATEEKAHEHLRKRFVEGFQKRYDEAHGITTDDFKVKLLEALNDYIVAPPTGSSAEVESIASIDIGSSNTYIALRKVVITYDNSELDTTSSITTDIILTVPTIRMFDSHDYVWDYAIIANEGVYIKESGLAGANTTVIQGNVFGGSSNSYADGYGQKTDGVFGGINVRNTTLTINGETIVSGADFNIQNANVTINGLSAGAATNLWTGSLNVNTGTNMTIAGNMFLNNDLEINGDGSVVALSGNYYGYNNKYKTKETDKLGEKGHTQSSSILVNGRNNKLDLQGLDLLLISGRSYLDFTGHSVDDDEYGTGEALSFITNQFIYMVPTEFLNYANPEKAETVGSVKVTQFDTTNMAKNAWFGSGYLKDDEPVRQEVIEVSGAKFVYFFLNFKSEADERAYVERILNATSADPQAYEMKCRMQERVGVLLNSDLLLQKGSINCNVYSNFAVMQYEKENSMIQAVASGSSQIVNANLYSQALNPRYAYLMATLDPQTELALDAPGKSYMEIGDEPLSTFAYVNPSTNGYAKLSYNAQTTGSAGANNCYYKVVSGSGRSYEVIIAKGDLVFENETDFHGVILTTGDVTLKNCIIDGLILAKGTVTLENSTVRANRELLQSLIEIESLEIDEKGLKETNNEEELAKYFVSYLKDPRYNGTFPYGKDAIGTDYTEFITYENWKKGVVQ